MARTLFIFGIGYAGAAIAQAARAAGWIVHGTGRGGDIGFDDTASVRAAVAASTWVLSTIAPDDDGDPVLERYRTTIPDHRLGYLSSTGVYGDAAGAWVDESAPVTGRRPRRNEADAAWLALGARVLRLPGIYGPGRSPIERVRTGQAHRVDLPGQVFSRVHVADIASATLLAFDAPAGAYNIADDLPCAQNRVVEHAAAMLGLPPPPFVALASLSPMARAFYADNRRVANGKAKRVLGWRPRYPTYVEGLRSLC